MPDNNKNAKGPLIAADFLTHTVKAFLIGVAASVVLGGAVILLAQSGPQDDTPLASDAPAIEESR